MSAAIIPVAVALVIIIVAKPTGYLVSCSLPPVVVHTALAGIAMITGVTTIPAAVAVPVTVVIVVHVSRTATDIPVVIIRVVIMIP